MPIRERILVSGITGSGKSYQWLKMAQRLKKAGVIFRCLDTDAAIDFMLQTQFTELLPENGGNVLVHPAYEWPDYKLGMKWLLRKTLKEDERAKLRPVIREDMKKPLKDGDWSVIDMADLAWETVQRYYVAEIFDEDAGDYFLAIRKEVQAGTRKGKPGGSPVADGLDGWKDWTVINKLYSDWILPIIYQLPTHVYATTKVEKIDRGEKEAEWLMLFGEYGVRPAGQKRLGHQMHTDCLMIPGKDEWFITTFKDRGGRPYFKRVQLVDFYLQYLVAKAGWPIV